MARLRIPTALAVVVLSTTTTVAIVACADDDDKPCTIEGMCGSDGRLCYDADRNECCPICPVDGQCPTGCHLDLPPV